MRIRATRLFDRSTRTSMKLWKKGARLKSKTPESASTLTGQALNHVIQRQNGSFHSGISASIFDRRLVCSRIECPVGDVWLFRKVEGRADAEVSAAAAIDEVVHRARRAVATDFFFVILEVMGVAGHGDFHVAARQEAIERGKVA